MLPTNPNDPYSIASGFPTTPMQFPSQGGMFGGGSDKSAKIKQALMAAFAGFNARRSPGLSGNVLDQLQQAATLKQRMAQAEAQRQQQMQDQIAVHQATHDYDIAHAAPPDITDRIAALNGVKPGLGDTYAQNYAANGGGLMAFTDPATGQHFAPAAKAPVPAPGTVEQGYRFKGGDPADQNNWEPAGGPTQPASGGFPR